MNTEVEAPKEKKKDFSTVPKRQNVRNPEFDQFNVRLPIRTIEWLRAYAIRKNCSNSVAVAYAIWLLHREEDENAGAGS